MRFTPFVGYYAGINRFTHVNSDFYATGNNVVLDVQDAQFYDSSWAFSFGPTGGLLIGLGPLELMGQVELRYMGGLSDVDPLSVADLKDINAESSRWSVPFLGGIASGSEPRNHPARACLVVAPSFRREATVTGGLTAALCTPPPPRTRAPPGVPRLS